MPSTFVALKNPDFRMLLGGAMGSIAGTQMIGLARGFLAYELTGSAAILGVVTLAQGVPMALLAIFGGVMADRVQKRKLLMTTQGSLVIISLVTAILVHTGLIEIWHLIVGALLQGAFFSFNMPSRQAYMVEVMGDGDITNAIALNNSGGTMIRIVAPTFIGFLMSVPFIGLTYSFYFISACYAIPVVLLYLISTKPVERPRKRKAIVADFKDGLSYVKQHEFLGILLIVGIVAPLLGNTYQQLLPVFASDKVFDVGPTGLGLMSTFAGVGALAGSLAVATYGNMRKRGLAQLGAGALFGVGLVTFGLSPAFPAALASLLLVGFAGAAFQTLNSTLLVNATEPEYFGRVTSVQQVINSVNSIATLPTGVAVDAFGAQNVILVNGTLLVSFWASVALFVSSYRKIEIEIGADRRKGARPSGTPPPLSSARS